MSNANRNVTAIVAILIGWIFYLYSYIARVEPSVLVTNLMDDFGATASIIGQVISVMYVPYVLLQVPCGIITDKLGVKKMIVISAALCGLGALVFGAATTTTHLQIGRFLVGLSSAPAFLSCSKIASTYFDKSKFAMLMGVTMVMGCLGGIFGTTPIAAASAVIGWRSTTFIIASLGVLLSIAAMLLLKEPKSHSSSEAKPPIFDGLKIIAKNPKAWILGLYGAMTYLPLSAIAELWGVPFIGLRFGIGIEKASISSIVIFSGFALGGIISAWLSEKINSYKKTIIVFTAGLIFCFSIAFFNDSIGFYLCLSLLFAGSTFAGANTLSFALALQLVPHSFAATSTGFTNSLIMTSGIVFQPLLGKLLDFFRNGLVDDAGAPVYDVTMYRSAFAFVIVGMAIAFIATFFINDIKKEEA